MVKDLKYCGSRDLSSDTVECPSQNHISRIFAKGIYLSFPFRIFCRSCHDGVEVVIDKSS